MNNVNVILLMVTMAGVFFGGMALCVPSVGRPVASALWRHSVALDGALTAYRALKTGCNPPRLGQDSPSEERRSSGADGSTTNENGHEAQGRGRFSVARMPAKSTAPDA